MPLENGRQSVVNPPRASVVICTRNRPRELARCLQALSQLDYSPFEMLVVDNASDDNAAAILAERWHARYTFAPIPGLSRARNVGAREARADIVAYLDDDAIPDPAWLSALVAEFSDPRVMAVAGQNRLFIPGAYVENPTSNANGHERQRRWIVDRTTHDWFCMANFGGIGDGMNMAFRRSAWNVWPGFDERLGRGAAISAGEEHLAFFQLMRLGYRVVYTPDATVRHPIPAAPEGMRQRQFEDLRTAAAYTTMLFVEYPAHSFHLIRHLFRHALKSPRPWRARGRSMSESLPFRTRVHAVLSGIRAYCQARKLAKSTKAPATSRDFPAVAERD